DIELHFIPTQYQLADIFTKPLDEPTFKGLIVELVGLSARVESSDEESLGKEDASKQGRKIADIDADKGLTLIDETTEDQERINNEEMFDTYVLNDEEMFVESVDVTEQAKENMALLNLYLCLLELEPTWLEIEVFATMVEHASGATSMNVPSTGKATASPAEGEKNTKGADINLKDKLVDHLGKNVMTQYYTKKLLFDKYCDKMLKRKISPKITKCKVLIKKGPITLKIYREDESDEVISNLKTRLDQLTQTEQELKIDLNKPLKEQDPLNELNELANKKRKRTSYLKDHLRSTKKHKSSSLA
nr:retrovirus-related Pol polyprotein from transposon TNT 1-94 [Tanacetum cinerariifolium]